MDIRQRIEADLARTPQAWTPGTQILANKIELQKKAVTPVQAQLEHYLYISDKKMLNLK